MAAEDVVRFYQELGFFKGADAAHIIARYTEDMGKPPREDLPWDDVHLLAYSEDEVWSDDAEADVCAANLVYTELLPEWARISGSAFAPSDIREHWATETGPVTLTFLLAGQRVSVSPSYQDDWIDLEVLQQINSLILSSGRQFESTGDGNFAVVMCLTPDQKKAMRERRSFPFGS